MHNVSDYPNSGFLATCGSVEPAGPIDQLKMRKSIHEQELAKINAALEALEKNPELANIMQLVGKALH